MIQKIRPCSIATFVIANLAVQASPLASAETVPFQGSVPTTFVLEPTLEPWGVNIVVVGIGNISHLGRAVIQIVQHVVDGKTGLEPTFPIGTTFYELTAANGDKLTAQFRMETKNEPPPSGAIQYLTFGGTFYITGGTGRFAGALGSADFRGSAVIYPPDSAHPMPYGYGEYSFSGRISIVGPR
jgi:hypothetical protein